MRHTSLSWTVAVLSPPWVRQPLTTSAAELVLPGGQALLRGGGGGGCGADVQAEGSLSENHTGETHLKGPLPLLGPSDSSASSQPRVAP